MFSNGLFVFLFLVVSTPISWSQNMSLRNPAAVPIIPIEEKESADIFLLCKREKGVRWLRAYRLDNGKCKTTYSKEGYLQVISSATYFASCEGVLQSVRKNLEEGGFKCTAPAQVSFTELDN